MVTFTLENNTTLSSDEIKLLSEAKKLPVVYDEDSPELTEAMEKAFVAARTASKNKI